MLLLIDKPVGPTSHAVVSTIKRTLKADKVGHLGTLDPFASGLLPIMLGNTARLSDAAMNGQKGYLFTIRFGSETDTLDPTGRVVIEAALPENVTQAQLSDVLKRFTGVIEQVPPVYSALKMNGMPLYEHIRATGKLPMDIETKRRLVTVHNIEILPTVEDTKQCETLTVRVRCSKGTYVRSLARDIAQALGTVGTCVALRREFVEPWHVDEALKLELDAAGRILIPDVHIVQKRLLPPWAMAPQLERLRLASSLEMKLLSGNPLMVSESEFSWESKHDHTGAESRSIFVGSGQTLFLCDALMLDEKLWKFQPRKRIL